MPLTPGGVSFVSQFIGRVVVGFDSECNQELSVSFAKKTNQLVSSYKIKSCFEAFFDYRPGSISGFKEFKNGF